MFMLPNSEELIEGDPLFRVLIFWPGWIHRESLALEDPSCPALHRYSNDLNGHCSGVGGSNHGVPALYSWDPVVAVVNTISVVLELSGGSRADNGQSSLLLQGLLK